MKIKVGTQLEESVLQALKIRSAHERKPMAEIIQAAIVNFLKDDPRTVQRGDSLLGILDNPIRLSREDFKAVLNADYYEQ